LNVRPTVPRARDAFDQRARGEWLGDGAMFAPRQQTSFADPQPTVPRKNIAGLACRSIIASKA